MYYDIYGISRQRNEATVERFLSYFCDRSGIEPLENQWLQVYQNVKYQTPEVELPLFSIAEMTAYAVENPSHAFVFYHQKALRSDVACVIVKFTYDGKVVFGVSIKDQTDEGGSNYSHAQAVEAEIRLQAECYKTYISVEYPPANDEEEFDAGMITWQNPHN